MVPFVLAQKSRASFISVSPAALEAYIEEDRAFFAKRGIEALETQAKATWEQTKVTKSTATPPFVSPPTDSDEERYNQPDEHWDTDDK
jgi:hypothetical protein